MTTESGMFGRPTELLLNDQDEVVAALDMAHLPMLPEFAEDDKLQSLSLWDRLWIDHGENGAW